MQSAKKAKGRPKRNTISDLLKTANLEEAQNDEKPQASLDKPPSNNDIKFATVETSGQGTANYGQNQNKNAKKKKTRWDEDEFAISAAPVKSTKELMLSIPIQGLSEDQSKKDIAGGENANKQAELSTFKQMKMQEQTKNPFLSEQASGSRMSNEMRHLMELQRLSGSKGDPTRAMPPPPAQVPSKFYPPVPYPEPSYRMSNKPTGFSIAGPHSYNPSIPLPKNIPETSHLAGRPPIDFQNSGPLISSFNPSAPKFSKFYPPNPAPTGMSQGPTINPYHPQVQGGYPYAGPQEKIHYPGIPQNRMGFSSVPDNNNIYQNPSGTNIKKGFSSKNEQEQSNSGELPNSLKDYVAKCLYVCNTEEETTKMQAYIIDKISSARKAGILNSIPWESYQVPNLTAPKSNFSSGFSYNPLASQSNFTGSSGFGRVPSNQRFTSSVPTIGQGPIDLNTGLPQQKGGSNLSNFQKNTDINLIKRNWSESNNPYQFRDSIAAGTTDAAFGGQSIMEEDSLALSSQKGKKNKKKEEVMSKMGLQSLGSQKEILERSNRFKGAGAQADAKQKAKKNSKKPSTEKQEFGGSKADEQGLTFEEMAEKWKIIVEFLIESPRKH